MSEKADAKLTVYYDSECPICRMEINHYRGIDEQRVICFADAREEVTEFPADLTRDAALARLYVRREDGKLVSGAEAFVTLWMRLPGWRWLATLRHVPGMMWVMERGYILTLRVRPWLVRTFFKRHEHV
jgi:predicted DCC family thiol-disulfide oxidoreductase YuxK